MSRCLGALIFGLTMLAGCGGSGDAPTQPPHAVNKTVDVFTPGTIFSPTIATITVGDTVRWNFQVASDGFGHNVVFAKGVTGTPADISKETRSGSVSRVFTAAGTFQYVCTLHGSMAGSVVAQ